MFIAPVIRRKLFSEHDCAPASYFLQVPSNIAGKNRAGKAKGLDKTLLDRA